MKLKSTLWALALACAAVSCSDDLENGPGSNGTDENNGQKAYLKINISTVSDGMMTKADPQPSNPNNNQDGTTAGAGWGEDGNGWLGELPGKNEGMVHDINIFLVETDKTTLTSNNHLDLLNTNEATILNATFAGTAYKLLDDPVDASINNGNEANHGSRNVTVTMKKDLDPEGERFQVFTIINTGDLTKTITTLEALRDYIQKGGETSVIMLHENDVTQADKFVMSTHRMCSTGTNTPSIVTLSPANTAENPASTSVYVERLAARIDLAYPENAELTFNNSASPVYQKGSFELTGYMVVNQWKGGTYMFKQVTPQISKNDDNLTEDAGFQSGDPKKYLGDEVWNNTDKKFNFVNSLCFWDKNTSHINTDGIWTKEEKTGNDLKYYDNYFSTSLNNSNLVKSLPTGDLKYQESNTDPTFFPIAYVRENTMNTSQQVNGFSTGVIFRTKFTPGENFTMMQYETGGTIKADATIADSDNFQFLTAEHYNATTNEVQKLVYTDVKTVAARAFNIAEGDTKGLMQGFMDEGSWNNNSSATIADVREAITKMSQKNKLSELFKKYLLKQLENVTEEESTVMQNVTNRANLTYGKFVEGEGSSKSDLLNKSLANYTSSDIVNLADWYGIYFFRNGQSYHKFWIRHDDNNDDNKMGVMEFAIVRNNVYQLNVTGVTGLGDPLPFTPGKDDPDTPDENNEVTINVTIYVKDWVKRKNKDIILQ